MAGVTGTAEDLKALLMRTREMYMKHDLAQHEAEVEREQRSIEKSTRIDALFRDLMDVQRGLQEDFLRDTDRDVNEVDVVEVMRVVEENHQTRVAQIARLQGDDINKA